MTGRQEATSQPQRAVPRPTKAWAQTSRPPRIALFDLGDTLTDHRAAFCRWAREFGATHHIPESWIHALEQMRTDDAHWRITFFERLRDGWSLRLSVAELHHQYRIRSAELVPHQPLVCEAIADLQAHGWHLGVITNGDPTAQRIKLERSRLAPYFSTVIVSGEYGIRKPQRPVFDLALGDLGAHPGTPAVMVGDSLDADVRGGTADGLATVWISGGRTLGPGDPLPTRIEATVTDAAHWLLTSHHLPGPEPGSFRPSPR